jgi:metal-dependent amidase/aminoacylase/carboxypeptidase family protein
MDALPVTEETGLPFASKARGQYNGREVGVMHACGHDFHMSILLGAAEVLAGMKADLPGTVKIVFQPAEEGVPGEPGGAEVMVKEGTASSSRDARRTAPCPGPASIPLSWRRRSCSACRRS